MSAEAQNRTRDVEREDCDHCGAKASWPCRFPNGMVNTNGPHIVHRPPLEYTTERPPRVETTPDLAKNIIQNIRAAKSILKRIMEHEALYHREDK